MELRAGYKQTEVGVIPEDWDVVLVRDITLRHKQGFYTKDRYVENGTKLVRITDLMGSTIDYSSMPMLKVHPYEYEQYKISKGDFLFARSGAIGRYGIVKEDTDAIFGSYIIRFVFNDSNITNEFFGFSFETEMTWKQLLAITQGSSNININAENIKSLLIPLPPKAEQEAIAGALSDADGLIESLEQLIAKKRHLKQGAMQQLLTGKKRLPGFSGEWEVKGFGEIVQPRTERIDPRRTRRQKFCIELEHIEQGTGCLAGYTETSEGSSLKSVFQEGDVLFGKLRAYLRKYWLADCEGVCSTEIWVLMAKPSLLIAQFLYQLVKVDSFIEAASSAYGTHMPRSDWNVVKNYEVGLPPVPEQTAIAAVLSDMDGEIEALETKLGKVRQLKAGMMHNLLTGRIRLM